MPALRFNAFLMNTGSHIQHGQWRHPDAQQIRFNDLDLWIDVARRLEAGLFDTLFFADVVGLYGPIGGSYEVNAREGLQIPSNDPLVLLAALVSHTKHIGLALTSSVLQAHPFDFARKLSTLDHLSKGRVGWNIVTSSLENSARNFGFDQSVEHDERYVWADEYMDVVYKLWEGSWDEGALPIDRKQGVFADASRIHKIHHKGPRYQVEGPHLPSPSLQRTPLLFQAGSSHAGRRFAARHAEAQFIMAPHPAAATELIMDTRRLAVEAGRRAQDIRFFQGFSFITGSTEAEVRAAEEDYNAYASREGFLTHQNFTVDRYGRPYAPDTPLAAIKTNAGQSQLDWLRKSVQGREPTVADLGDLLSRRSRIAGTPEQIADKLEEWQRAGIDGVNVINWRLPDSYDLFIEQVLPELRKRGLAQTEYTPGSLRKKLFGGDLLNVRHPGARYRGHFARQPAVPIPS